MMPKIGIGITTRNRTECLKLCLDQFLKYTTDERIVLFDDASFEDSYNIAKNFKLNITHVYSPLQLGVAKAKNECLKRLKDCDYIFLFDDDCFPILEGWIDHFINCSINTGQQMLIYNFNNWHYPIKPTLTDKELHYFSTGTGAMIFLTKKVIDIAGGMSKDYGLWGHEHNGYAHRIHNLGLTPKGTFTSPVGCDKFIYSLDIQGVPSWLKGRIKKFKSCESEPIKRYWSLERKTLDTLNKDINGKFKVDL